MVHLTIVKQLLCWYRILIFARYSLLRRTLPTSFFFLRQPLFQGRKIEKSYYKSQHTGSFSKRRKKRTRCADSYELICNPILLTWLQIITNLNMRTMNKKNNTSRVLVRSGKSKSAQPPAPRTILALPSPLPF